MHLMFALNREEEQRKLLYLMFALGGEQRRAMYLMFALN